MKSLDVLGLGIATMDILTRVPRPPASDEVMAVPEISVCGGGPVATALVQLARLGERTEFLGSIGADVWGDMIERDFDREGVEHGRSPRAQGSKSLVSVILVEQATANRSILYHRDGLSDLPPEVVTRDVVGSARLIHLDGFHLEAALRAATLAREEGVVVSFDGGAGVHLEGVEKLLAKVDLMIVAKQFAVTISGSADLGEGARCLGGYGARQVVITDGVRGSWYWDESASIHEDAFRVSALDTTGAGDVFHGAYLHGFLAGWDPRQCLRFASAAAALKCMHLGGRGGLGDEDAVHRYIAAHQEQR